MLLRKSSIGKTNTHGRARFKKNFEKLREDFRLILEDLDGVSKEKEKLLTKLGEQKIALRGELLREKRLMENMEKATQDQKKRFITFNKIKENILHEKLQIMACKKELEKEMVKQEIILKDSPNPKRNKVSQNTLKVLST